MKANQASEPVMIAHVMIDEELLEQCIGRVLMLETLLRYVLQEGMTKEAYRRIGQALENKA